jgi:hypothetical protein
MNSLRGNYRHEKETPNYKIKRSNQTSSPHVLVASIKHKGSNFELLADLIRDTEPFIVEKMLRIVLGKSIDAKDRKAAISYCFKSYDMLTKAQIASVLNATYRLMAKKSVGNDIKVKLAEELKAFIGGGKTNKDVGSTYEKMLQADGVIKIDE